MKRETAPVPYPRLLAAAMLVILPLLSGCGGESNDYTPPPAPPVTATHPIVKPVTDFLDLIGSASAVASVDLVARAAGYLESVNFTDGSIVDKDDLLFVIEPAPYEANVHLAEATLAQQQAQLTLESAEYERQLRLVKTRATSQSDLDKSLAQRNSASAAVDQAKANIEIAKINLGYTRVTAPFAGRMGRHLVDVGNLVGAPSPTKLATIEQLQPIYVYFNVDEPTVLRIHAMMRERSLGPAEVKKVPVYVGLQTDEGYPHEGTLDFIDTGIDPSTGTLQVRAVFPNADHVLLPGAFVRVHVPVGRDEHALLVSNRALGVDQGGSYALVIGADDIVEQRAVGTGVLVDGMRVITKGLRPDDWVVVEGLQRATPGTKVAVTHKDAAAAGPSPGAGAAAPASRSGSH